MHCQVRLKMHGNYLMPMINDCLWFWTNIQICVFMVFFFFSLFGNGFCKIDIDIERVWNIQRIEYIYIQMDEYRSKLLHLVRIEGNFLRPNSCRSSTWNWWDLKIKCDSHQRNCVPLMCEPWKLIDMPLITLTLIVSMRISTKLTPIFPTEWK